MSVCALFCKAAIRSLQRAPLDSEALFGGEQHALKGYAVGVEVGADGDARLVGVLPHADVHLRRDCESLHEERERRVALLVELQLVLANGAFNGHSAHAVGACGGNVEGKLDGGLALVHSHEVGVGVDVGPLPVLEHHAVGLQRERGVADGLERLLVLYAVNLVLDSLLLLLCQLLLLLELLFLCFQLLLFAVNVVLGVEAHCRNGGNEECEQNFSHNFFSFTFC